MFVCKNSFVFRLITPSKMKTGPIAFHLAHFQLLSVPVMKAFVFQRKIDVLTTLGHGVYQGASAAKNAAGTWSTPGVIRSSTI